MVPNIFQVLTSLLLSTFCVNYVKTTINYEIFSIIDENTLQRKLEFTVNDSLKIFESSPNQEASKLLQYVSLVSDEMNELNQIEEQNFKENSIKLLSSIVELSQDEVKFHEISFDDFENVKKAPVRLETVIPDGSDPNTIKIIYESKINEMVLSGLAEINGTNYDFVFNITDLTLREEHEKTPAPVGKIVTKSILETLTLKRFTLLIMLTDEKKFIKSPNRQILRQLANSWLVTIVNVVNSRFVRPKITAQSQSYFRNYKNDFLQAGCSSILESFASIEQPFHPHPFFKDRDIRSEDMGYNYYSFSIEEINNFSNTSMCSSGSLSVQVGKNCDANDNYYSHALTFTFTYSSDRKFAHPFFNWTLFKNIEKRDSNHYYSSNDDIKTTTYSEKLTSVVRYWSAKVTIFTDKNGRKTENELDVSLHFDLENSDSSRLNDLSNRFLGQMKNEMAKSLRYKMNSLLMPPAKTVPVLAAD